MNNKGYSMEKYLAERKYFKLLFIVYVFTNTLALGYLGIDFNPLVIPVIIYGVVQIIYGLIKKEIVYSKNHLMVIGLYGLLLFIATVVNTSFSNVNSYIIAIMQILIFVLLFAQPKSMSLKKLKNELKLIIPTVSLLVGIASTISLFMYLFNVTGNQNGWPIGLVGGRLFGVYFNCNPASFLALITIILSVIAIKNNYSYRYLYLLNIVIQLAYVILTQCRAALLILALICTSILYYYFIRSKELSKIKKMILNVSLCLAILFGSVMVNEVSFIIPEAQGAIEDASGRFQFDKIKQIISLTLEKKVENIPVIYRLVDQVSSSRLTLSADALRVWYQEPLYGIGAGNFRNMEMAVNQKTVGTQILHSHNVFLESLVTAGIFGCVLFLIFFFKTIFVTRDVLKKYQNKNTYFIVLLFMMIFVCEFIGGLFDFGFFYVYSLSASLAWMFLGYIYWLSAQPYLPLLDNYYHITFNKYELISIDYNAEDLIDAKPQIKIINTFQKEDYVIRVAVEFNKSVFVYDLYYTKSIANIDNDKLLSDFYSLIKDELSLICEQSSIK